MKRIHKRFIIITKNFWLGKCCFCKSLKNVRNGNVCNTCFSLRKDEFVAVDIEEILRKSKEREGNR